MACVGAWRYDHRRTDASVQAIEAEGWRGELQLDYEHRNGRTVLARRRHSGPLQVQKAFYPEGAAVCHSIVIHPPGGIVGGDRLRVAARIQDGGAVLLTTPGAAKWYRSSGAEARQESRLEVGAEATLEWLPQPSIVFDGARGAASCEVQLHASARYIGWEIVCLGRTAAAERFHSGRLFSSAQVVRANTPLWLERARIEGGSRLLDSPVGLAGAPVWGTLLAAVAAKTLATACAAGLLGACRSLAPAVGRGAITRLPGLLVARYAGPHTEAAQDYFVRLWAILRPALLDRPAVAPRIWST